MRSVLVCLVLSVVAISADLQSDIEDVASHLPVKEIESIGKQYVAKYPSYADGLRYVDKITYEQLVKNFLETKEGQELIDYFGGRGIDIQTIWLYMTKQITDMNRKWLEPIEEGALSGPEITGDMMADYKKAIAESDFIDTVHKKMDESPEFANLVAAFKDPEFHSRFYRSVNSKALFGSGKNSVVRGFWASLWGIVQVAVTAVAALFG